MTFRPFGSDLDITGFQAMWAAQEAAVQNILAMLETFANVTFVQNPDGLEADIQFGTAVPNSVGFGTKGITYLSWDNFAGNTTYGWLDDVDVFLTNDDTSEADEYDNTQRDTFAYSVLVHEIGHALGFEQVCTNDPTATSGQRIRINGIAANSGGLTGGTSVSSDTFTDADFGDATFDFDTVFASLNYDEIGGFLTVTSSEATVQDTFGAARN